MEIYLFLCNRLPVKHGCRQMLDNNIADQSNGFQQIDDTLLTAIYIALRVFWHKGLLHILIVLGYYF